MDEIDRWEAQKKREWKRRGLLREDGGLRVTGKLHRLTPKQLAASNPELSPKEIRELYEFLYHERPRGRGAK